MCNDMQSKFIFQVSHGHKVGNFITTSTGRSSIFYFILNSIVKSVIKVSDDDQPKDVNSVQIENNDVRAKIVHKPFNIHNKLLWLDEYVVVKPDARVDVFQGNCIILWVS